MGDCEEGVLSKVILLSGARGVVGQPLWEEFERRKCRVVPVSRSVVDTSAGIKWDMEHEDFLSKEGTAKEGTVREGTVREGATPIDTMVHCAPIWLLPRHLPSLAHHGLKRLIVFSSSSVLSKKDTQDSSEQELVRLLGDGEQSIASQCNQLGIAYTIFRPSMIYGFGLDENISRLARFINRWGFAVVAGKADGLRQPVHTLDLVDAVVKALDEVATYSNIYTLAGAEVLSYRNMVSRIFEALNKPTRVISIPVSIYRCVLRLAALTGGFAYTAEMADRMNSNLAYDNNPAIDDFDYAPKPFLVRADRDLAGLLV
jgi:nucleoside-diphosphate-sugar epimerase